MKVDGKLSVSTTGEMTSDVDGSTKSGGATQYIVVTPEDTEIENGWSQVGPLKRFVNMDE